MKTMFITGGNEGIGFFMVKSWLKKGNNVAVLDLNCENLIKLKETYPQSLLTFQGDVCDKEMIKTSILQTNAQFGSIHYAIHNACVCIFKSFETHQMKDFNSVMDVNFYGAINMSEAVIPIMKSQKKGKILFVSSGVGVTGYTNISSYACSKGAIESLAKCLNNEYLGSGITFHIMHPPLTNTKSSSPLPVPKEFKASPEKVGKGLIKNLKKKKFIISSSFSSGLSVRISYLFPIFMGKLLVKMTNRASQK